MKIDEFESKNSEKINEIIRKLDSGKYRLYSHSGKNLGTYDTRAGAEKREQQVNYFKHTESVESEPDPTGYQHDLLTAPQYTLVIDTPGELDWYKIGQHFPTLAQQDPHEYGQSETDMMITLANQEEMDKLKDILSRVGVKFKDIGGTHEHPEIHMEKWSKEYKQSIDCDNPKGFSQRAHCQGRKKTNEAEIGSMPDWETIVALAAAAKMTPMAIKAMWKTAKGFYKLKKFADRVGIKLADKIVGEDMSESMLNEMILRTSPIQSGSAIPPYTTIFAHKDSIWIATPNEWKENRKQITDEINQSLGITDNPMPVSYTGEGLYDIITERNIRDILVFIKYDDDLIYHRSAFKQSPQTSPLFKKVGKFLSQKFDLTTNEMRIFTMGVGQEGFTNDKVEPDSLKGSLPTVGYHGTNIDALQSILKKGIMSQDSGNYGEIHTPGYVFFAADNSKILQSYAGQSAGGIWTPTSIPVTVHFKIPDQTKIRPDVDVAHDLYGGDEAKRINPDYKHLDFPDKSRTPTQSKRPEKKWQHAEVFGYKGRIPASHIIGISMPKKFGGPNTNIKQVIENIKAWNALKTKYSGEDLINTSKTEWVGKSAEQIVKDVSDELNNENTVGESMTNKKSNINEQPMTRPNNNPNFIQGIGMGKTHNQTLPSAAARTAMNNQSGYATPVYPTAPGQSFNPTNTNKTFSGINRQLNPPAPKQYSTPIRPTNAQTGPATPQKNYSNSEMNAMFNSASNKNPPIKEEILKFNSENPMSSEVLIQGYGTMSIETLMKNVMREVDKLAGLRDNDPQSYRNLQHSLYNNSVFRAKLDALVGALDELQEIKRKGGKRSANIQREASEQEQVAAMMGGQQPQDQTMPIDIGAVLGFINDMESKGQFTPEYADKIRRAIGSLQSARKTLSPHVLLQVMTMLTQGRR